MEAPQKSGCLIPILIVGLIIAAVVAITLKATHRAPEAVQLVPPPPVPTEQPAPERKIHSAPSPAPAVQGEPKLPPVTRNVPTEYKSGVNGDVQIGYTYCQKGTNDYTCFGIVKNVGVKTLSIALESGYANGTTGDHMTKFVTTHFSSDDRSEASIPAGYSAKFKFHFDDTGSDSAVFLIHTEYQLTDVHGLSIASPTSIDIKDVPIL